MTKSTITSRGRTTVPAEIRKLMGLVGGARLVWSTRPDGTIVVEAAVRPRKLGVLKGRLALPNGPEQPLPNTVIHDFEA